MAIPPQLTKFKPINQFPHDEALGSQSKAALDTMVGLLNQLVGFANAVQGTGIQTFGANIIDPTGAQIISAGSRTSSLTTGITAQAQSTLVNFYWDGTNGSTPFTIYRDDNTAFGPFITGSPLTVTGLTNGTQYFFYPYFDDVNKKIAFATVAGTSVGSPAVAFTSQNILANQQQILRGHIPLGILFASTPVVPNVAPSTVHGGGGGGGAGGGFGGRNIQ